MFGDADVALSFADGYNGRNDDGTYRDNSTEAFRAINCLDYTYQTDVAVMREKAAAIAAAAPTIGPYLGYGDLGCVNWPYQSDRERSRDPRRGRRADPGRRHHRRPGDAVRVGGRARRPARQRACSSRYEGEGHTAYNKSNACVNDAVETFLIDGTVPATDPKC